MAPAACGIHIPLRPEHFGCPSAYIQTATDTVIEMKITAAGKTKSCNTEWLAECGKAANDSFVATPAVIVHTLWKQ